MMDEACEQSERCWSSLKGSLKCWSKLGVEGKSWEDVEVVCRNLEAATHCC